jgi:thiol-disulfide isomerase/thioredoxin
MKIRMTTLSLFALCAACDASDGNGGEDPIVREGGAYPAVRAQDCDGNEVDMRQWLAQRDASFVTFGALWCEPCKEEAPVINRELVDGLASRGDKVGVVQILIESQPEQAPPVSLCADWRDTLGARFVVLVDSRQEHLAPFFGGGIGTLPLHLIVTGDGVVRYKRLGALPSDIKATVEGWLP